MSGPPSLGLMIVGLLVRDVALVRASLGAMLVAAVIFGWLRREGRLELAMQAIDSFDQVGSPAEAPPDFTRLVRAWDDLSVKRGTPDFDPWQLLSLRRQIEARTKDNPKLADYWRDHRG